MKKRYVAIGLTAIVIAVITLIVVLTFPLWRTAYVLHGMSKAESLDCQIQMTLNGEELSEGQQQFLQALSVILGLNKDESLKWQAKGRISGQQGYVEIYCDALKEPVTEVYVSKENSVVNIKMLYDSLQKNFTKVHPVLGKMIPDWTYGDYISLEQIQEIFQVDLREIFEQNISDNQIGTSLWENLMLLNSMERHRTKEGWQFETVWKDYQVTMKAGKKNQKQGVEVGGTAVEKTKKIAMFSFTLCSGEKQEIDFPESLMEQEEIEQFKKLWDIVKGIQGESGKEQ